MSVIPDWQHIAEAKALNWKCIICNVVALSSMFVEDQWLVEYGPHKDIVGVTLWLKCSECCTLYHVSKITQGKYICTFMGCKKI